MNTRRTSTIAIGALLFLSGAAFVAPPWVALGVHARSYPVTGASETANVVIDGATAYASMAERGFAVIDVRSGTTRQVIAPPPGSGSVDDLAIADGLLFALDARPPGALSVFSLAGLALTNPPVDVAVGPFSGVSAGGGRVIVSGGTSRMSLRAYEKSGKLGPVVATADFGRGQPDVALASDGSRAFISTHYWGPYFGVTTARVGGGSIEKAGAVDLDTYGFTAGGAKPASFPLQTALDGDTLLIADADGLAIVDVAQLAAPRVLAHLDLGVNAVGVAVRDHVAAVAGSSPTPRLVLVDVPSRRLLRSISLPSGSYPTGVAIGDTRIAVAAHRNGVLFIPR